MGIDSRASIFVGLARSDIEHVDLQALIDGGTVSVCPPHYDGEYEDYAIVGREVAGSGDYEPKEFAWNQVAVDKAKAEFKELFGQEAKVWISPYIY